ncbi:MAG: superoxide dismutase [Bdellovibrio sp.]|nr:superoxide dismutase [Methylotenera sp.]
MSELTIQPVPQPVFEGVAIAAPIAIKKHQLPALKYDYAALEPTIDARTMMLHFEKHHGAYVKKLNEALEKFPDLQNKSAVWLLCHLDHLPTSIKTAVHNNAGGHVNHGLFWRAMKPCGRTEPTGALRDAINRDFGGLAEFKQVFEDEGAKVFGSGWVWLVCSLKNGANLQVITTTGHDNPLMQNLLPVLLNDVWEHAHYLSYENRRPDYLKAWWAVVDWDQASANFEKRSQSVSEILSADNALFLAT